MAKPQKISRPELKDLVAENHVSVHEHNLLVDTPFITVTEETFSLATSQSPMKRLIVGHDDAVAVLAVRTVGGTEAAGKSDSEEILLIRQYRHATRRLMWEIPAGLCDKDGEDPKTTALRELREETDYEAATARELVNFYTSPGFTNEKITCYVVQNPTPAATAYPRTEEEAEIERYWVPLTEVYEAIRAGNICCPTLVTSVLAYISEEMKNTSR